MSRQFELFILFTLMMKYLKTAKRHRPGVSTK